MRVAVLVLVIVAVVMPMTAALVVHVVLPAALLVLRPMLRHLGPLRFAGLVRMVVVTVRLAVRMLVAMAVMVSSGAVAVPVAFFVRRRRGLGGERGCHGAPVLPLDIEVGDQGAGPAAEDLRQVHAALLARDHLQQAAKFRGRQGAAVLLFPQPLGQSACKFRQTSMRIGQQPGTMSHCSGECSAVKLCVCEPCRQSGALHTPSKHAPWPGGSVT